MRSGLIAAAAAVRSVRLRPSLPVRQPLSLVWRGSAVRRFRNHFSVPDLNVELRLFADDTFIYAADFLNPPVSHLTVWSDLNGSLCFLVGPDF